MGSAVESNSHFVIGHGDVGRHVDEITEDLARLGIVISTHAASHQAIERLRDDQERHVEIDLEADR